MIPPNIITFTKEILNFIQNNFKRPILSLSILYFLYLALNKILQFNLSIPYENYIKAIASTIIVFEILIYLNKVRQGISYYFYLKKELNDFHLKIRKEFKIYLHSHPDICSLLKEIINRDPIEYNNIFPIISTYEKHQLYSSYTYKMSTILETNPSLSKCIRGHVFPTRLLPFVVGDNQICAWGISYNTIQIDHILITAIKEVSN
ncbi:hypothetical protein ACFX5K_01270 [Rickettsiales bacterium LUAb2]